LHGLVFLEVRPWLLSADALGGSPMFLG
jgi:hypothetical protein